MSISFHRLVICACRASHEVHGLVRVTWINSPVPYFRAPILRRFVTGVPPLHYKSSLYSIPIYFLSTTILCHLNEWGSSNFVVSEVSGSIQFSLCDDYLYDRCCILFHRGAFCRVIWQPTGKESGPGSSVGIATDYGLDGPGIKSRWGRDLPPVQTGPGAHPASCTMGIGSFSGVRYGRGVLLTTHPLLVPWSWKSRAIPLPTL